MVSFTVFLEGFALVLHRFAVFFSFTWRGVAAAAVGVPRGPRRAAAALGARATGHGDGAGAPRHAAGPRQAEKISEIH